MGLNTAVHDDLSCGRAGKSAAASGIRRAEGLLVSRYTPGSAAVLQRSDEQVCPLPCCCQIVESRDLSVCNDMDIYAPALPTGSHIVEFFSSWCSAMRWQMLMSCCGVMRSDLRQTWRHPRLTLLAPRSASWRACGRPWTAPTSTLPSPSRRCRLPGPRPLGDGPSMFAGISTDDSTAGGRVSCRGYSATTARARSPTLRGDQMAARLIRWTWRSGSSSRCAGMPGAATAQ